REPLAARPRRTRGGQAGGHGRVRDEGEHHLGRVVAQGPAVVPGEVEAGPGTGPVRQHVGQEALGQRLAVAGRVVGGTTGGDDAGDEVGDVLAVSGPVAGRVG